MIHVSNIFDESNIESTYKYLYKVCYINYQLTGGVVVNVAQEIYLLNEKIGAKVNDGNKKLKTRKRKWEAILFIKKRKENGNSDVQLMFVRRLPTVFGPQATHHVVDAQGLPCLCLVVYYIQIQII